MLTWLGSRSVRKFWGASVVLKLAPDGRTDMEDMSKMVNKAMIQPPVHKADCGCGICSTIRAAARVDEIIQSTKEAAAGAAH